MAKLLYGVLVCLAAFALPNSLSTPVSQCVNNNGELPLNFHVTGCDGSPCDVIAHSTTTLEATFTVPRSSNDLTASVTVDVDDTVFEFALSDTEKDACSTLQNGTCPVQQGQVLLYDFALDLSTHSAVPSVIPIIGFVLSDDTGVVFCVNFSAQLVADSK